MKLKICGEFFFPKLEKKNWLLDLKKFNQKFNQKFIFFFIKKGQEKEEKVKRAILK